MFSNWFTRQPLAGRRPAPRLGRMNPRVLAACLVGAVLAPGLFAQAGGSKPAVRIDLDDTGGSGANAAGGARAKSGPAAAKKGGADAAKKETPAKIDGMEVSRGDRGYLGVKVENNTFRISFYDTKKKPVAADVSQIALRWPVHYQPNDERALLLPEGDGKVFTSGKVVRPPFSFKLYLTLLKDAAPGEETVAETYIIDFRQ